MKVEKTKPIDVEKMTGVKDDKNVIKESELCENCRGNFYNYDYKHTGCCGFEKMCKYLTACRSFIKVNNHLPSYYRNIKDKYNGEYKDRGWNNMEENNTKNVENVKEETKLNTEITEKELCEYCGTKEKCVSCRYSKNCDYFGAVLNTLPYYFLSSENKYIGGHPDRVWEEFGKDLYATKRSKEKVLSIKTQDELVITEKKLCEYCGEMLGVITDCINCKFNRNCSVFCKVTNKHPYYLLSPDKNYIGTNPNRLWGEKEFWEDKESRKEENKGTEKIGVGIGVKEKDLCKACYGSVCISCRYSEICKIFKKEKNRIPSKYAVNGSDYIGSEPDRIWKIEKDKDEKENNEMKEANNENKENNNITKNFSVCADNECIKYPIKGDEEYVCIFYGNAINSPVDVLTVRGSIINICKDNVTIYNKENKEIYMIDIKEIKCLLPEYIYSSF